MYQTEQSQDLFGRTVAAHLFEAIDIASEPLEA